MNRPAALAIDQYKWGIRRWQEDAPFTYDYAYPIRPDLDLEIDDIGDELLNDDVYGLCSGTGPGDVWVDAGSHIGLFSIAAMQAGAEVACIIDMDPELAWCAWRNVTAFQQQSELRGRLPQNGITPAVLAEEIRTAQRLYEASMMPVALWEGRKRSCLKMDIQGAESAVLADGGAKRLADAYDVLVMEWHHSAGVISVLEAGGWRIDRVKAHVDVLLNIETSVIWATSG